MSGYIETSKTRKFAFDILQFNQFNNYILDNNRKTI